MTDDTNTQGDELEPRRRAQEGDTPPLTHGDWFFDGMVANQPIESGHRCIQEHPTMSHAAWKRDLTSSPTARTPSSEFALRLQARAYMDEVEAQVPMGHICPVIHPEATHAEWKRETFIERYGFSDTALTERYVDPEGNDLPSRVTAIVPAGQPAFGDMIRTMDDNARKAAEARLLGQIIRQLRAKYPPIASEIITVADPSFQEARDMVANFHRNYPGLFREVEQLAKDTLPKTSSGGESTMAHNSHPMWITPECPHCSGTGYPSSYRNQECGYCMPRPDGGTGFSKCGECNGKIWWQDCPTGGWWIHDKHPEDHHDAVPTPGLLKAVEKLAAESNVAPHEMMRTLMKATPPPMRAKSNSRYRSEPVPGKFDKSEPTVHWGPVAKPGHNTTRCCHVKTYNLPAGEKITRDESLVNCPKYFTGADTVIGETIDTDIPKRTE